MRTDIGDEIRRKLPAQVAVALDEVEKAYRRRIPFFLVSGLGVTAGGRSDPAGFVELPLESRGNLNVIAEEIMHLHRWTRGYPAICPESLAYTDGYSDALKALGGYFDEYSFFPFLESAGLSPRSELEPGFAEALDILRSKLPFEIPRDYKSREFTLGWRVKLAVTHVRALLLGAPSLAKDSLLKLYSEEPLLQPYADLGSRVSSEIAAAGNGTPEEVEAHMQTCLHFHLGLPPTAATVLRPFHASSP